MSRIRTSPNSLVLLVSLLLLLTAAAGFGQTSTSAVRGKVVGANGQPIAGAEVNAVNQNTGNVFTAVSGRDGSYLLAGLRPGTYDIIVASPGYEPKSAATQVLVGQTINANFNMSPAVALSEEITVFGQTAVEMKTSEISTNVAPVQIENLPQNSRNFLNFAALAPGIIMSDPDFRKEFRSGAQEAEAVNVFIDGISYKNDILAGGIVGQDASRGNPFPQAAVQEFRVLTQNYSAEFQKSSSAIITAVTKSGTNALQGEVFAFLQDDALVDDNPITAVAEEKFERLQGGLTLGGPIIRDRLHYFLSYESNGQERSNVVVMGPGQTTAPSGLVQQLSQYEGLYPLEFDAHLFFGKGTWQPTGSQIVDVSAFIRTEDNVANIGNRDSPESGVFTDNDVQNFGLRHQLTSSAWFNEASVDYQTYVWHPKALRPDLVGRNYADILIVGGRCCEQDKGQQRYSLRDDLMVSPFNWAGRHLLKVGANVDFTKYDLIQSNFRNPMFHFRRQENWEFPWRVEYGSGDPQTGGDNTVFGAYVQDEWSPIDRLQLNLGVRYDYESEMFPTDWVTPENIRRDIAPFVDTDQYFTDGDDRSAMDDMIAPRLGVTYDLLGTSRTIIFGGWGRYYDRMIRGVTNAEKLRLSWQQGQIFFSRDGGIVNGNQSVVWQDEYLNRDRLFELLEQGQLGRGQVFLIENDTKAPYADQWNIGVRHRFGPLVGSLSYGNTQSHNGYTWGWSKTVWDMARNRENGFSLNALGRCCGSWGALNQLGYNEVITSRDDKRTWYEAIYLTLDKPMGRSFWSAGLAYTGTLRSERQGGDDFSFDFRDISEFPMRPLNDNQDHYLVANAVFRLPANLSAGTVVTYGSGRRFDIVDRSVGTGVDQQILYGEGEGSSYLTVDLRLQYDIQLGGMSVALIGEAFNLTNDEVESSWENVIFTLPDVNPILGQPRQIVDNSQRRLQYGVRLRY